MTEQKRITIINFRESLVRLFISWIFIRMILQRELPIRTLYLIVRSAFLNLENVVKALTVTGAKSVKLQHKRNRKPQSIHNRIENPKHLRCNGDQTVRREAQKQQ